MTMFANRTTHAHIFGKASCTNLHLRNVAEHVVTISCQPKVPGMLQGLGKIMDFDAFFFRVHSKYGKKVLQHQQVPNWQTIPLHALRCVIHRSYRRWADQASCEFDARVGPSSSCAPAFDALPIVAPALKRRRGESGRPSPAISQSTLLAAAGSSSDGTRGLTANCQHGKYEFRTILRFLRGSMPTRQR